MHALADIDQFHSKLLPAEDVIFGSILIVFGLVFLVGNGGSILLFCQRNRKFCSIEVFLTNLGINNGLLTVIFFPMVIYSSFTHGWSFEDLGCECYAFTIYFLGLSNIIVITAIAVVRCITCTVYICGKALTRISSYVIVVSCYAFALALAAIPLIGIGNYTREPFGLSCTLNWIPRTQAHKIYIKLVAVVCVFIPLLIITSCYLKIFYIAKHSSSLMKNAGVTQQNRNASDNQLSLITVSVTVGFFVGWGPYAILSLWSTHSGKTLIPALATAIPALLANSSIAYNPHIYTFLTSHYRKDFRKMLCKIFWSKNTANGFRTIPNNPEI